MFGIHIIIIDWSCRDLCCGGCPAKPLHHQTEKSVRLRCLLLLLLLLLPPIVCFSVFSHYYTGILYRHTAAHRMPPDTWRRLLRWWDPSWLIATRRCATHAPLATDLVIRCTGVVSESTAGLAGAMIDGGDVMRSLALAHTLFVRKKFNVATDDIMGFWSARLINYNMLHRLTAPQRLQNAPGRPYAAIAAQGPAPLPETLLLSHT
jgi:hypothetical protein